MRRPAAGLVLSALCFLLPSACGETPQAELRAAIAEGCAINSECNSPLVCAFRACHVQCASTRDCVAYGGGLCIQSDKPYRVCQNPADTACTRNSDCPGTLVCGSDRRCRDACAADRDCGSEQTCVAGTCAERAELIEGALPQLDPPSKGSRCLRASDCPAELICLFNTCAAQCVTSKDCDAPAICEATRCVIPATNGGAGGAAGRGGAAGQASAGMSGGGGVSGGNGGDSSGGAAGQAGGGTGGQQGAGSGGAGNGGDGGRAGSAGSGGASSGSGGIAGSAGGGSGGAGTGGAGNGGEAGSAGEAGSGGEAGNAGSAGEAGAAGEGGQAGSGGSAGAAGAAGLGGEAGSAGVGGQAGGAGEAGSGGAGGSGTGDPGDPVGDPTTGPTLLGLDETNVYWVSPTAGTLSAAPKAGGATTILSSFVPKASGMAVAGDRVWVSLGGTSGDIRSALKAGGTGFTVTQVTTVHGMIFSNGFLYYLDEQTLYGLSTVQGFVPFVVAGGIPSPTGLASDGTDLVWGTLTSGGASAPAIIQTASESQRNGVSSNMVTAATGAGNGAIGDVEVSGGRVFWTEPANGTVLTAVVGGARAVIASGQTAPTRLAVDQDRVYWTAGPAVWSAPRTGGAATRLSSGGGHAYDVAVDGTHVYWTDDLDGAVLRLSK